MMQRPLYGFPAQSGFSLIEVMITVIVLAVGLIGLGKFQATLIRDTSIARERSEATALAQSSLEQFRNFSNMAEFNDISSSSATTISGSGSADFSRTITVASTSTGAKAVGVNFAWQDAENHTQQVNLNTGISALLPDHSYKFISPHTSPLIPDSTLDNGGGSLCTGKDLDG
ncbi:MAG: hypothetical protein A2V90_03085 [Gammaproteobacteria bacterium RBG_16_57_12]|nr:MAG: hypothetical protein A2V90_03085 [Gammaproteobacteria bacterium RBG_16_57_12]